MSPVPIAFLSVGRVAMPKMVSAPFGPMPETLISISKNSNSSRSRKPYRSMASSRTWVWMKKKVSPSFALDNVSGETDIL